MKVFQFDECLNSKRLEAACKADKKCIAHRFPKRFKGRSVKDPVVIQSFFSHGKAIVTNDAEMLEKHVGSIPEQHPGLVVVIYSNDCHDELTDDASAAILRKFKSIVPSWADLHCDNSVLILTEKSVTVLHKDSTQLRTDLYSEYTAHTADAVAAVLGQNRRRLIPST
jgi:hypothetical protein